MSSSPNWIDAAVKRAQSKLQRMVDCAPEIPMKIREGPEDAPGWILIEERYSAIPHVAYPFDPDVLRAIRQFCPDATAITIESVWLSSRDDGERHHMKLVRHGIARFIEDPQQAVHDFYCDMPVTPYSGFPRFVSPNYIEINWYNRRERPWGFDMPGAYLPFDWDLYYALYDSYYDGRARSADEFKELTLKPHLAQVERERVQRADEIAYKERDLARYRQRILSNASEIEMRDYLLGDHAPARKPMVY